MILIYLILEQDQFSPTDAYYFPESIIPISRMSEPKNFTGTTEPRGRTVLCAELPSDPGQPEWELSDLELGRRLTGWLERARLPVSAPIRKVVTRRLSHAYPVYTLRYHEALEEAVSWLDQLPNLWTAGRQGLFLHNNTHHSLLMGYRAADAIAEGWDRRAWAAAREGFNAFQVAD